MTIITHAIMLLVGGLIAALWIAFSGTAKIGGDHESMRDA